MIQNWAIISTSLLYLGVLFAIAYYGDKRAQENRSIISNPYIYSLSLAVYCTAWTFYGSVGRAANTGVGFLPIYLGPTLMAALWVVVLRKIIRISKKNRITSIADFISSRYGKSPILGGIVTVIAVIGIVPYLSLQLKAISISFQIISTHPGIHVQGEPVFHSLFDDTTFYIALILALFTILFGTRHLDATERHEGLVAAIAFESVVKLIAFLAVGIFVTYGLYNGFGDVFTRASRIPELEKLFTLNKEVTGTWGDWLWLVFLSMMAIMFLPRQFQVAVIENVNEKHVEKAVWLFPLYLFVINLFVLPIAFGGMMHFSDGSVNPDTFVLSLPIVEKHNTLALLVFIGGFSAATSMVIVETIALSTMFCNDLAMPILLNLKFLKLDQRKDLSSLLLFLRRSSIVLVLLMGYFYFRFIGEYFSLVSIGLISFCAVAQFAPAILGGIFWKGGSRTGALAGLIAGFIIWVFTLPFPSLVQVGILPERILTEGLFGVGLLKPYQLFGLQGFNPISHTLFWSMLFNVGLYVTISLYSKRSGIEQTQASLFVDIFKYTGGVEFSPTWRGTAPVKELHSLLRKFLGEPTANRLFRDYARKRKINLKETFEVDADFVQFAEQALAATVGSATARAMISTVVKEEPLSPDEVKSILDETQQVIAYSRKLEEKSRELERATAELKAANQRLQELDRLKDDFVSTVTHELRTPLTSVRAFSEILYDNTDLELSQRQHFLKIIIKESERLTRLINQLLDLQKIESDTMDWNIERIDIVELVKDAVQATSQLMNEKSITLDMNVPDQPLYINGDPDRLTQVMLNLLSNAIKFSPEEKGLITINIAREGDQVLVSVKDNGIGIRKEDQGLIFEKFRQVHNPVDGRPSGSGLGLAITRQIVEYHQGKIWVESSPGLGSTFFFTLPLASEMAMETSPESSEQPQE
ncbi:MAG: histidine kinase [Calditrichaeota bacterium]|nr:MAG: histidine kinase [Calditrichota bacterium]